MKNKRLTADFTDSRGFDRAVSGFEFRVLVFLVQEERADKLLLQRNISMLLGRVFVALAVQHL